MTQYYKIPPQGVLGFKQGVTFPVPLSFLVTGSDAVPDWRFSTDISGSLVLGVQSSGVITQIGASLGTDNLYRLRVDASGTDLFLAGLPFPAPASGQTVVSVSGSGTWDGTAPETKVLRTTTAGQTFFVSAFSVYSTTPQANILVTIKDGATEVFRAIVQGSTAAFNNPFSFTTPIAFSTNLSVTVTVGNASVGVGYSFLGWEQ